MRIGRFILPTLLVVLAALPVVLARRDAMPEGDAPRVIIYTPHNEQIR